MEEIERSSMESGTSQPEGIEKRDRAPSRKTGGEAVAGSESPDGKHVPPAPKRKPDLDRVTKGVKLGWPFEYF